MKTILLYALGIPCVLVGSRIAGFDTAFTASASKSPPQVTTATRSLANAIPAGEVRSTPDVSSDEALPGRDKVTERLTAVVVPGRSIRVEAAAAGLLRKILVEPDQSVEEGQPLALLDTRGVEAEIRKQHHELLILQSKAREAAGELRNLEAKLQLRRPLAARGIISAEELHELNTQVQIAAERIRQAEAEVARSQEEIRRLEESLDRYVLSAPFSGEVKRIDQHVNHFVQEGDVVLEMESAKKHVRALVPSELAARIQQLTFHVEVARGDRADLTVATISPQDTIDGYELVLFDVSDANEWLSNQPLTIQVGPEHESAATQPEPPHALAVR